MWVISASFFSVVSKWPKIKIEVEQKRQAAATSSRRIERKTYTKQNQVWVHRSCHAKWEKLRSKKQKNRTLYAIYNFKCYGAPYTGLCAYTHRIRTNKLQFIFSTEEVIVDLLAFVNQKKREKNDDDRRSARSSHTYVLRTRTSFLFCFGFGWVALQFYWREIRLIVQNKISFFLVVVVADEFEFEAFEHLCFSQNVRMYEHIRSNEVIFHRELNWIGIIFQERNKIDLQSFDWNWFGWREHRYSASSNQNDAIPNNNLPFVFRYTQNLVHTQETWVKTMRVLSFTCVCYVCIFFFFCVCG